MARPGSLATLAVIIGLGAALSACIKPTKEGTADASGADADVGGADTADPEVEISEEVADEVVIPTDTRPGDGVLITCGDGVCGVGETRITCPVDCGCGNGTCESVETMITCPADCCGDVVCGDCTCDAACGENLETCPRDCFACGDGVVTPGEIDCGCILDACRCPSGGAGCGDGCCMGNLCGETPTSCARDCGTGCGNGICDPGETPLTCDEDCTPGACGNGQCEGFRDEDPESCPADCAAVCGNCACEFGETYLSCPPDCGVCGDGICSNCLQFDERTTCPVDCP